MVVSPSVALILPHSALPADSVVWGTGGWIEPREREALDWLTLVRWLGWKVQVCRIMPGGTLDPALPERPRAIVLCCEPDDLAAGVLESIESVLSSSPALIVSRAGRDAGRWRSISGAWQEAAAASFSAASIDWTGPPARARWDFPTAVECDVLKIADDVAVLAHVESAPAIVLRELGRGRVATLAFHPSEARDADPIFTRLLAQLVIFGSTEPAVWLDFEGTLILRMDDPGGAQNAYSRTWCYPKLDDKAWTRVADDLESRGGRLSMAYVAGWVDDGDAARGHLKVDGRDVPRRAGAVYPSPLVEYVDIAGHRPGARSDYASEYRGIQKLRARGLGDVELHGYTHMHPDREAWARAADRFENSPETAWFRELGRVALPTLSARPPAEHPLAAAVCAFHSHFGMTPTTFIPPGDQWTDEALERALDLGLRFVSSYYQAIRYEDRFCWTMHVCAPYLDEPDGRWFRSSLPTIGYFHDQELAVEGTSWMTRWLDRWREAGALRLVDFREVVAALDASVRLERTQNGWRALIEYSELPPVRDIPLAVWTGGPKIVHLNVSRRRPAAYVD